jgi:hypothetical protein
MGTGRKAGVRAGDPLTYPEHGTPQGGLCSPMLAHICRHQVLEAWGVRAGEPRRNGRRGAAEVILGCARVGLTRHATQTGRVSCRTPASPAEADTGHGTCACLGLTHDGTQSRRGAWVITRHTAGTRRRRAQQARWQGGRDPRQTPLPAPSRIVCQPLRGHSQDAGLRGHDPRLAPLSEPAVSAWRSWRSRRSPTRALPWETCDRLHDRVPRPAPSLLHAI